TSPASVVSSRWPAARYVEFSGHGKRWRLHRVVAMAFHGIPEPPDASCRHLNGRGLPGRYLPARRVPRAEEIRDPLRSPDPQRGGDAVDVVEPRGDQGDLEDGAVVEAGGAQPVVVLGRDPGRVPGDLDHVVDHDPLRIGDGSLRVVLAKRLDERVIQG